VSTSLVLPAAIARLTLPALLSDYVPGKLRAGPDLPRMPPLRLGAELAWQGAALGLTLAARHVFEQDDVAELEIETGSHTFLDAGLTWRPGWRSLNALVFVKATNLLDEVARARTSPLKDTVPLAGRSFGAGLRIAFSRGGG
jgi:iron complex outermembrane receptor protein